MATKETTRVQAGQMPDAPAPLPAEMLLSQIAIERLIAEYTYLLDHGATERLHEFFTEDGTLEVGSSGCIMGRDAIRAFYAKRSTTRTTRHLSSNLRLTFIDADHARGVRGLTYYAAEGPPPHPASAPFGMSDYEEVFVRGADGAWRFAARKPTPIFGFRFPLPPAT